MVKKIFILISILLILVTIPAIVYFSKKGTEMRSKAAPNTSLTLTSSNPAPAINEEFVVHVDINTGDNLVNSVSIDVRYDPAVLTAEKIDPGTFLTDPLFTDNPQSSVGTAGRVKQTYYVQGTASFKTGSGTVANITFKAKAGGSSSVWLNRENTLVFGQPDNNDVLSVPATSTEPMSPVTITVSGGSTTVTPIPTITSTPNPLLTITPMPDLIATPSAMSSASATTSADLVVSVPGEGAVITETKPTIQGKGTPGSIITIIIHSGDPITATATVSADGTWSYTPTSVLADGSHTVTATQQTPNGSTQTTTQNFMVQANPVPISGSADVTMLILLIGGGLVLLGMATLILPI